MRFKMFLPAVIFFLAALARAGELPIRQFGGLNTDDARLLLQNGQTADSENVVTDEPGGGLSGRKGFVEFSTSPAKAIWEFPHSSGARYIIIHSSHNLLADTGSGTFSTLVSTVAADLVTVGAVLGDKFYFSNTTDGLKYWNTTSVTVASSTMKFTGMVAHKGRLWGIGVPANERTLYASAFNDGTDWTLQADPADDDPAQFILGGANDEVLTAIYASFQDKLIWFKPRSFGGIYGTDRSDFAVRTFSDQVGTAYKDSVQDCSGYLRWLGPLRTVWEFDGSRFGKISEDIDGIMGAVTQGDANARNFTFTSKDDFDAGTNTLTSNALVSGDIVLSTWTATDTSSADFNQATLVNMTTQTVSGAVYLLDTNIENHGFESGTGNDANNWTELNTSTRASRCGASVTIPGSAFSTCPQGVPSGGYNGTEGSFFLNLVAPENLNVQVLDASDNVLETLLTFTNFSGDITTGTWSSQSVSLADYAGQSIKIRFDAGLDFGEQAGQATSDLFICNGEDVALDYKSWRFTNGSFTSQFFAIDNIRTASGNIVSRAFDTAFSSPVWTASGASWTSNGYVLTAETQSSSDGISFDSLVSWSTGSAPTSAFKRYIRYKISVTTTSAVTGLPYIDDVTFAARAATGSWVSSSFSLGQISAFSTFGADDDSDGGTIAYTLYTDSDTTKTVTNGAPVAGTYLSSQVVTSGAIPTLSTAAYAFVSPVFASTVSTQSPAVHSVSLNWNEGSGLTVPSGYPNQRYWLGVTISSSNNNRVLVYDKERQWQRYSGIDAISMAIYSGRQYFGNNQGVFLAEEGFDDNGADITSYYTTPQFAPSGWDKRTVFHSLWLTTDRSESTIQTAFRVNGITSTSYSLGNVAMNSLGGTQVRKVPFPFSEVQKGKSLDLKWTVAGSKYWRLIGADLEFMSDPVPME